MTATIVFVVASLMVFAGAIGVITRPNPVHAALSLVLTLFGIAVHFVALQAHFLAAVEVIVYAGAIVVLFLFVIMLLGVDKAEDIRTEPLTAQRYVGPIVGLGIAALTGTAVILGRGLYGGLAEPTNPEDNIRELARSVFSDGVFAFELVSVLLVIAVVGAVLLARRLPAERKDA